MNKWLYSHLPTHIIKKRKTSPIKGRNQFMNNWWMLPVAWQNRLSCVWVWTFEVCACQYKPILLVCSPETNGMFDEVFSLGDGSQSWFHMNTDNEKYVNLPLYSNWSGIYCLHCAFCDVNALILVVAHRVRHEKLP